tara:strand:- start:194 stop:397 length:204 start_codon:yes stop_codon:yes gene_type:complete
MAKCGNCGANMSCGCQKRTASNGAIACSTCINTLEGTLKNANVVTPQIEVPAPAPTRWGANRYNKTN